MLRCIYEAGGGVDCHIYDSIKKAIVDFRVAVNLYEFNRWGDVFASRHVNEVLLNNFLHEAQLA